MPTATLAPGAEARSTTRLFAGAKELGVLEAYRTEFGITLFDRALDFGVLYFMTKPIFQMLTYFYSHIGNFGLALMLLTVVVKLLMYPLANKSYIAMSQMKRLQPEMMRIRDAHMDDKMRMNQEIMAMYKREKVNPAAGCLPILIQIPVFFALYKVLFVTIEMRHAPFYGWIHDLSAPDPTNFFTLFGLIAWSPPGLLHIGVLPIVFALTMYIQQSLNPAPTDPVQAKVFKWLPAIFLFLFASFPAGLVLYWTWSNVLSILQQKIIMWRYNAKHQSKH
jgi:YidC/Oxa1 family membrane protein insertase